VRGVTTEALIFLGELDPEAVGPALEFATHYEPTPVDEANALLDALTRTPERTTFVDLGSGMGRVVLLAAERPYRQVVGVEISPALHEVAKENRSRYPSGRLRCRDIRLVRGDAGSFVFPQGDLAVYLYNPFRAPVVEAVVARLAAHRGAVALAYHTPLERAAIDAVPAFEPVAAFAFGAVWRKPAAVREA
jgi:SAM-dependent methyltransferase